MFYKEHLGGGSFANRYNCTQSTMESDVCEFSQDHDRKIQNNNISFTQFLTCPHKISRVDRIQQHIRNLRTNRLSFYIQHFLYHGTAIHVVCVGGADPAALLAVHDALHDIVGGSVARVLRGELCGVTWS